MTQQARRRTVHFSGIGGTGMVAGARLAVEAGWEVRGSDNPLYPPTSEMVAGLNVPVATKYAAEHLDWHPEQVVIGNALSRGNPEVEAVLLRQMHYVSLPEWLKEHVLRGRRPIAVCGTHGKTTTTALTAFLLDRCGLSPGFFIGGQPQDFEHSARLGVDGGPFVIEGDEYDTAFFDKRAKFFHYLPEIAVVTSLEFDHGDIYPDIGSIELAFQRMLRQISPEGWLLCCADNSAVDLKDHAFSRVATYGFTEGATWRGEVVGSVDGCQEVRVYREGAQWTDLKVPMAGRHNLHNALAGVAVAATLGAEAGAISEAMMAFKGVRRRMEIFLDVGGVIFIDDFAHHPTAIRETIGAARSRWPERRLRVLFEPRSNTTVTRQFQDDFTAAFLEADEVHLAPIYRPERIPEGERLEREGVIAALRSRGIVAFCSDFQAIADAITKDGREGDVVLMLSNGAFGGLYETFRKVYGKG
jgi:UDP-N-acetylmuramate: L-alanyl-gamma-D-glutamyl-meso-diaminopimelate ligase